MQIERRKSATLRFTGQRRREGKFITDDTITDSHGPATSSSLIPCASAVYGTARFILTTWQRPCPA